MGFAVVWDFRIFHRFDRQFDLSLTVLSEIEGPKNPAYGLPPIVRPIIAFTV